LKRKERPLRVLPMASLSFDVVIVGAGPAGLMAARKAAEKNVRVLLCEKDLSLGAKRCGEAVSGSTLQDAGIQPSPKFVANKIKGFTVYAPDESKKVEIWSEELGFGEGYILEKPVFLREMAARAVKAGAEIWMRSEVLGVERRADGGFKLAVNRLSGKVTVEAKILLGCDGVTSLVAQAFFERKGYEVIPCIQYKLVGCRLEEADVPAAYVGREVAPKGYVWVFPKSREEANVGVGVRGAPAKPYLDKFIERHPEMFRRAQTVEVKAAPVPISGQISRIYKEDVMLCGDAAGQVIPLTGGGIHSSIVAGKIAGELAGAAVAEGEANFSEYPKRYTPWSNRIYRSLTALRLIENLGDEDLNMLAEVLDGRDIIDLANGFNLERVGAKLSKHPAFAERLGQALLKALGG
jgi:digeranylgeranylglycerophospholipid reductase